MNSTGLKPVTKPVDVSVLGATTLSSFLHDVYRLEEANELIARGSIYLNKNRVIAETWLSEKDCIRVHIHARRFDTEWNWSERIVAEEKDFFVINKPAGIPVHPTCDNEKENVLRQLERFLQRELWLCHRLDIGTEGLLVVAKSVAFRRWFAQSLEARSVEKHYRTRAVAAICPGRYEHYQPRNANAPFGVTAQRNAETDRFCALTVESCEPVDGEFEVGILLHTGRHHQIRAQLAALGAPVVGDVSYGAPSLLPVKGDGEVLKLQSAEIGFRDPEGNSHRFQLASPWR